MWMPATKNAISDAFIVVVLNPKKRISKDPCSTTSIFDIEDSVDGTVFVAASDGMLYQYDLNGAVIETFRSHHEAIKCARENPVEKGQVLTTSRDGSIAMTDIRCVGDPI